MTNTCTLSIPIALVTDAKGMRINLSAVCREALKNAIVEKRRGIATKQNTPNGTPKEAL
jgi:post-segregation antitoxin (ccd killing protein)